MADEKILKALGLIIPNENGDDDYDYVGEDGTLYHSPDCIYTIVLEEQIYVELRDTGELIEAYWEKGWHSGYGDFHRANYDHYKGRYVKSFPARIKLWEFVFTKSLRRVLKKNEDLKTVIRPLRITPEKEKLYLFYNLARYKEPPRTTLAKSYEYIRWYPSDLTELCVFKDDKLIACSIFEVGNFAMVTNTCFWDINEASRSLGTYTILREIQYALGKNMHYYYLGSYYKQNPNYRYKTRFRGLELFDWDWQGWIDFRNPRVEEMLNQKLPRRKD